MTTIVLAVLATAWLAYFAMCYRESRSSLTTRPDSMFAFSRALGALAASRVEPGTGRSGGPAVEPARRQGDLLYRPRTPREASRRRRHVVAALAATALLSLLAVPSLGAAALVVHLLADLTLAAFLYSAASRRSQEAAAASSVRVLHLQPPAPQDDEAAVVQLRRTADG